MLTAKELIEFEENIATLFDKGWIPGPVHLHNGCENQLIEIFQHIKEEDYVLSTWRSHYHCLLKGIPKQELIDEIFAGHSITLNFPQYKVLSSAIVGNIFGLGVGIAESIKLKKEENIVWVFAGDMSFHSPYFSTAYRYAINFDLPIRFICENNRKSVCTPTAEVWGQYYPPPFNELEPFSYHFSQNGVFFNRALKLGYFEYKSKYEHAGTTTRTQF